MQKLENSKEFSEDMRLEQLRLKQLLNLKAKGFYLENVGVNNQNNLPKKEVNSDVVSQFSDINKSKSSLTKTLT